MNGDDLVTLIQNMAVFVSVIFVVVEFIKKVVRAMTDAVPGWAFFLLSASLGVALAYGWTLKILPDPGIVEFNHLNTVLTGLIMGGAASGLFSGMDSIFPDLNL